MAITSWCVRRWTVAACVAAGAALANGSVSAQLLPEGERCRKVSELPAFDYKGQRFSVAPGLKDPQLRRIDAAVSTPGCLGVAAEMLDEYRAAKPDDFRAEHVALRIMWITGDDDESLAAMKQVAAKHPDFGSVKTLIGSLLLDREGPTAAIPWFDQALAAEPGDAWAYGGRVRARAMTGDAAAIAEAEAIAMHRAFPPGVRDQLGLLVVRLRPDTDEKIYRELLTVESRMPLSSKQMNLAYALARRENYAELIPLLERLRDDPRHGEEARLMLAGAHLRMAYAVSPTPNAANRASIDKAVAVMGSRSALIEAVRADPFSRGLEPLLQPPRQMPTTPLGQLCLAIETLDMHAAIAALGGGAAAEGPCNGKPPLMALAQRDVRDNDYIMVVAIARSLLDAGASADSIASQCGTAAGQTNACRMVKQALAEYEDENSVRLRYGSGRTP